MLMAKEPRNLQTLRFRNKKHKWPPNAQTQHAPPTALCTHEHVTQKTFWNTHKIPGKLNNAMALSPVKNMEAR